MFILFSIDIFMCIGVISPRKDDFMGYNGNNGNRRNDRNFNRRNDDRFDERKKRNEERFNNQRTDLDAIIAICKYINDDIALDREDGARVTYKVKDLVEKVSETSGIPADNFKFVSQYSYIIADLGSAQFDKRVNAEQLAIKIRYVADRLFLGFMKSFHDEIVSILDSNTNLFGIPADMIETEEAASNASETKAKVEEG